MTPIPTLNSTEMNALLRHDFVAFIQQSFYELNPEAEYLHNWHIEVIAAALEDCRQGRCKRLIINVPPRSLKSHCATVCFAAWLAGSQPFHPHRLRLLCAGSSR